MLISPSQADVHVSSPSDHRRSCSLHLGWLQDQVMRCKRISSNRICLALLQEFSLQWCRVWCARNASTARRRGAHSKQRESWSWAEGGSGNAVMVVVVESEVWRFKSLRWKQILENRKCKTVTKSGTKRVCLKCLFDDYDWNIIRYNSKIFLQNLLLQKTESTYISRNAQTYVWILNTTQSWVSINY